MICLWGWMDMQQMLGDEQINIIIIKDNQGHWTIYS